MRTRIEAGTDIAMVGAWDSSRALARLTKHWGKEFEQTLENDARAGHLFLIHTGGDGGGPIYVFVDEEIPATLREQVRPKPAEFLLRVPTGQLVVGGVEDYRSSKPQITGADSVAVIPPGDYLLTCYVGDEESVSHTPSKTELERAVGTEDFQYYSRIERQGCLGYSTLLLFPALWPSLGWKLSAGITALVVVAFFYVRETVFLRRNARYRRIDLAVNEAHRKAHADDSPTFIFQLRKVDCQPNLEGGSIHLG